MGFTEGLVDMTEEETNEKIRSLISLITRKPDAAKKQSGKDIVEKSLADLQICIGYMLFDLEATTRERDHLRVMLSDQQHLDEDEDKPSSFDGGM